jgi:hypothetical protein
MFNLLFAAFLLRMLESRRGLRPVAAVQALPDDLGDLCFLEILGKVEQA